MFKDNYVFQASTHDLLRVAQIVKDVMENSSCGLNVSTPVKVKVGPSWGMLQNIRETL
jgi:shikimate 5-dehydrogenase